MMKKRKKSDFKSKLKDKILRKKKGKKLKKSQSKRKKIIINLILVFVVLGLISVVAFFSYIVVKAPKFNPNNLKFTQMSEIYDGDGNLIVKMGNENRTEITYDDLPEVLIDAIIATEDSKFFQHNGFDLARFIKASIGQALGKNAGGASTLTMQIAKNNYTSTVSSGFEGIIRKFTDIYLSIFKIEKKYTKEEIIQFYVNDSYLGNGAYGVEQASLNYFGKSVSDLNLSEASFIAGLFQSPNSYNPYNYPEKAEARRNTVLYLMQRHGYITEKEKEIAKSIPITSLINTVQYNNFDTEYQGYIDTVVDELEENYGINPYTTAVKIYTSMNRSKQDFINKVMNGEAWNWENDKAQAGVVMTESATGEVLAVGAGRNKNTERSYNFATMTNKHIGSTAKPLFDYGPAVQYLGWGTVNFIVDEPHTYTGGKPMNNHDGSYKGMLPMYQALGLSRNVPALKTFQQVSREAGNDKIIEFVTSLGITPEIKDGMIHEAHSIGAFTGSTKKGESRTSPMTMAGAYQAFSNGGYYVKPHTIRKIIYKENGETEEKKYTKTRVMKDSTAYIINNALHWAATEGLAKTAANIGGVETAAKTGTTNYSEDDIRRLGLRYNAIGDLWVCGYTPSQTITYWYGYDKITSEYHNTTATWTIRDTFYRNLAENLFDRTGESFPIPSSVVKVGVVRGSIPLKLANEYTPADNVVYGYFDVENVPKEEDINYSSLPNVSNFSGKMNGNKVTLTWSGISADSLFNVYFEDSFGSVGYDIYVKDGTNGAENYIATTTSNSFTHTTNLKNPVYVVYTAFANYKDNKSSGVSFNFNNTATTTVSDFDVKVTNETIIQNSGFKDNIPIIVLYNSVDITDECKIEKISGNVDDTKPGAYKLEYKITYGGKSKTVSRIVTVKENTTIHEDPITEPPNHNE